MLKLYSSLQVYSFSFFFSLLPWSCFETTKHHINNIDSTWLLWTRVQRFFKKYSFVNSEKNAPGIFGKLKNKLMPCSLCLLSYTINPKTCKYCPSVLFWHVSVKHVLNTLGWFLMIYFPSECVMFYFHTTQREIFVIRESLGCTIFTCVTYNIISHIKDGETSLLNLH